MRVLLVEDDGPYAALLGSELRGSAIDLHRVDTLDAAVSAVLQRTFDAILLDLGLPDSSGLATVERMHDHAGLVPILVLTSSSDDGLAALSLQRGAQDYLLKSDADAVVAEIAALRNDGARIAIDDFGTGYSNLARLRALPIDRVKLHPSLIADIESSEKARVIVQAVMKLIAGLGCEIVAEGVETSVQADILRAMGCDTIQGYVFAQPMFETEYLDWTRDAVPGEARIVA